MARTRAAARTASRDTHDRTAAPPADAPAAPAASPQTERGSDPEIAGPRPSGAPQHRPQPDWLHHDLTVTGPADDLAAWRTAAAGAGTVPWVLDLDQIEEDLFHRLVAPPRSLSLFGARMLARDLRDAVGRRHERAVARVGHSRACPFDLHVLVPVPGDILRLGPEHPAAAAWLWEHWGTWDVRHVTENTGPPGVWHVQFWSADWTPWRALASLAERWPQLRFAARPTYEAT